MLYHIDTGDIVRDFLMIQQEAVAVLIITESWGFFIY